MLSDTASVSAGYSGAFGSVSASGSFTYSQSQSDTQSVGIQQSQTSGQTVAQAATATLADTANPIGTTIWYDRRWGTLMFQAPGSQVSGITPAVGVPDTSVSIAGSGFWTGPVGVEFCRIVPMPSGGPDVGNCTQATGVSAPSNDTVDATVPVLVPGQYEVRIVTQGEPSTQSCGNLSCATFTVQAPVSTAGPSVQSMSPSTGPDGGGTVVTLNGTHLSGVTAVWFGVSSPQENPGLLQAYLESGVAGPPNYAPAPAFRVVSGSQVVACAPAVARTGPVWVSVFTASGWSPVTPDAEYQYTAGSAAGTCSLSALQGPPVVTSVGPATGPATGGTLVTIQGYNFRDQRVPAACQVSGCATGSTITLLQPPTVEFCEQDGGPCLPATDVQVLSSGVIQAQSPPGVGATDVRVGTSVGFSAMSAADQFTYQQSAHCACAGAGSLALGASPSAVAATGDASATIVATVFNTDAQPVSGATVHFSTTLGTLSASQATTDSAGVSQVTISGASPGAAVVTAIVQGNPELENQTTVSFAPVPLVSGLSVHTGPAAGGTAVTISGSGFSGATAVYFGAQTATGVNVVSGTEIQAVSPAGFGAVNVHVANQAVESGAANADLFTYSGSSASNSSGDALQPPAITGLSPSAGPVSGGTRVTVTGSGLTGATSVDFGSIPGSDLRVESDGTLRVTAPQGTGTVNVRVIGRGGTSSAVTADLFRYLPAPTVTGVSPASGPLSGGIVVTVEGSGLTSVTQVNFDNVPGTGLHILAPDKLTVTVPAGTAQGRVDVTVTAACGTTATADASSCGTSPENSADTYLYYPSSPQVVTRTLQPGWNTLSIPFALASRDSTLSEILGGTGSVAVAYAFRNGNWRLINPYAPEALQQPLSGLYLLISGNASVTATLIPAGGSTGGADQPSAPNTPPTLTLQQGWNLVGPSAPLGSESYSNFLIGVPSGSVPLLIDPNGADVPVTNPKADTTDTVRDGYAYWLYASRGGQTLVGQILAGSGAGGLGSRSGGGSGEGGSQ